MMNHKYFAYDQEHGFETFETERQAMAWAQDSIDEYREHCEEGWDEAVAYVAWGEIKQQAVERETGQQVMFEGELVDSVDYVLEDILLENDDE